MPPATCPPSFSLPLSVASALALGIVLLSACGAEVAGTAATVGTLQAQQASQARAQQQQIVDGMKQAQDAGLQRAADAASAGQ